MWIMLILIFTGAGAVTSNVVYFPDERSCKAAQTDLTQLLPRVTPAVSWQSICLIGRVEEKHD